MKQNEAVLWCGNIGKLKTSVNGTFGMKLQKILPSTHAN